MKHAVGIDMGGLGIRQAVLDILAQDGHEVIEVGTVSPDKPVEYRDVARNVAKLVVDGTARFGIVACATGMGISIAANKNKGIRCALVESPIAARESRIVNNANVLGFGGTFISPRIAGEIIRTFLSTEFHQDCAPDRVARLEAGNELWKAYEEAVFK